MHAELNLTYVVRLILDCSIDILPQRQNAKSREVSDVIQRHFVGLLPWQRILYVK